LRRRNGLFWAAMQLTYHIRSEGVEVRRGGEPLATIPMPEWQQVSAVLIHRGGALRAQARAGLPAIITLESGEEVEP